MMHLSIFPFSCSPHIGDPYPCEDRNRNGVPDCDERDGGPTTLQEDPSAADRDGDGVPDATDLCPDEAHLTPTGCAAIATDGGIFPDGGPPAAPHLIRHLAKDIPAPKPVSCVHASLAGASCGAIAWQQGSDLFVAGINPQSGALQRFALVSQGLNNPQISLCNVAKAVALAADCKTAGILWPEISQGNLLGLMFRSVNLATGAMSAPVAADAFPLPALGAGRLNTVAAIGALTNQEFVAVWTDRDRVEGHFLPASGNPKGPPFLVNNALDVIDPLSLRVINPDLAVTGPASFAVVWQEGPGQAGRIARALVARGKGASITSTIAPAGMQTGQWPALAANAADSAHAFISPEGKGKAELNLRGAKKAGTFTFGPPGNAIPNSVSTFSPSLAMATPSRLAIAWALQDPAAPAEIFLAGAGELMKAGKGEHYNGEPMGTTRTGERVGLAAWKEIVLLAFALHDPANVSRHAIAVRLFRWGP